MDQQCLIVHIYLIFFIHSVIDGHLSCFHILVMANKDSENTGVHRFSQISIFIFLGYSEVEFLGHMAVLFLVFLRNLHIVLQSDAPIHVPTNRAQGVPFLHVLTRAHHLLSFWWQPYWQACSDISLWFWFAFPWWVVMLSIFSCIFWYMIYICRHISIWLLWENVYSGPLPIL